MPIPQCACRQDIIQGREGAEKKPERGQRSATPSASLAAASHAGNGAASAGTIRYAAGEAAEVKDVFPSQNQDVPMADPMPAVEPVAAEEAAEPVPELGADIVGLGRN